MTFYGRKGAFSIWMIFNVTEYVYGKKEVSLESNLQYMYINLYFLSIFWSFEAV